MIVVKFGGHAMKDENGNFANAISAAQKVGEQVVVVHGGGPQIDSALKAKDIISQWIGGFRVTTKEIFDVVEDVLVNQVGTEVAATLSKAGIKAHAMSARTLPTVIANRRTQLIDGTPADLGFVGNVQRVNPTALLELLKQGIVPVIAPVSSDEDMKTGLNVNADCAAAIESISASELENIKSSFAEGMAPKVQAALDALSFGAKAVRIIDGTDPESFAAALAGVGGTLVLHDKQ